MLDCMKPSLARPLALTLGMVLLIPAPPAWATCGGGGGGGMGGIRSGGDPGMNDQVYHVPWKLIKPEDPPVSAGIVLYWFPTGGDELKRSSLRVSRSLSLYASQCVTMGVVDAGTPLGQKLVPGDKLPVAVLAEPDGTMLGKAENEKGFLKVEQVEKLVESEFKKRESALKERMESAKQKTKSGDNSGAIQEFRTVLQQKCLFPKLAKDAAKELKKLGVTDVGQLIDAPVLDPRESKRIERVMREGLKAEDSAKYTEAERLYAQAHRMDPADPAPLRYLGELYRHHTGEWVKARHVFEEILAKPADPISRAVAQHGLGKMTIHDGEFKKGLALLESSVQTFPLALAYRNLAVYWNSEGDAAKTDTYVRLALSLDPKDPYNIVFAAVFSAGNGHSAEALKIARANQALLPASYNLAAIYAQAGQGKKALALLQRHFFEYERYPAVRSKEMMEARVDAVFVSIRNDPEFLSLTSGADAKLEMPVAAFP